MPQVLTVTCVEGHEVAFHVTGEDQTARRREDSGHWRRYLSELPAKLSSSWVKRPQSSPGILAGYGVSTEPVAALLKGFFLAEVLAALFSRSHIEKSGLVVREFTKLPLLKRSFAESQWAWILNSLTGLLVEGENASLLMSVLLDIVSKSTLSLALQGRLATARDVFESLDLRGNGHLCWEAFNGGSSEESVDPASVT
jgi:hypothetical protein